MITLTAGEIALLVAGELHCDKDLLVSKAPVFDSRLATPGCIFLALKGETVDGHDFAADAYRAGAMFSLTTHRIDGPCIVCLLYTSPSPRDGLLSRMPSSA